MKKPWLLPAFLDVSIFASLIFMPQAQHVSAAPAAGRSLVYIGTYGKGVQAFRLDAGKASIEPLGLVGEVVNPSWVGTDHGHKNLYAVSELEGKINGGVASFSMDRKTGRLHPLNHVDSEGEAPCFLAVDATGKTLVVANYMTGGVASFPVKPDGSLGAMASLMTAQGSGPNKQRQEGPHAHEAVISPDNQRVYVPDLGLDKIRIYRLDAASSKLVENDPSFVKVAAGHGPRHIMFDKQATHAYVINELEPVVSVFSRDASNGNLHLIQTVPALPAGFTKENTGAEIRLDHAGKFLYTSNRGADTIQVFAVDPQKGTLTAVESVPTGGEGPRGFALDPTGQLLLVGNQKSNNLVVFKVDQATGKLTPTGQKLEVTSPVDVLFVPAE